MENLTKTVTILNANGKAVTGGKRIGKYIYVFNLEGKLIRPTKAKIVKVGKTSYYVDTKGHAYVGFFETWKPSLSGAM